VHVVTLMREALRLIDACGESLAAARLQCAIDTASREPPAAPPIAIH
jgi:hypothetical protein